MNYFTDDESLIARECISMLKALAVPASDIRGMGIQICKLSDDVRKQSAMPKTLHCFMNPVKESPNETKTKSGANMTSNDNDVAVDKNIFCESFKTIKSGLGENESLDTPQQTPFEEFQRDKEAFEEFILKLSDNEDECEVHASKKSPSLPGLPVFSPKRTSSSKR